MGDLANMTDNDGRVSGPRLLRWLRSHAEMEVTRVGEYVARGDQVRAAHHRGMLAAFLCMADDLEAELTPPDHPEDNGGKPERPCPSCLGTGNDLREQRDRTWALCFCQDCNGTGEDCTVDGDAVDVDDEDTGPCEYCGRLANRVPVRDNGRVFLGCPGCAARARGDGVNLDDPALTVDEDERNQS